MIGEWLSRALEKLPLHKLPPSAAYALTFNVLLFLFMTFLFASDTKIQGFPNAWDYRFMVAVNVAVFAIGVWDAWTRR
ncbi:hypothetical protein [Paenibacillus sp.]|uniref:hypothetical protein n=1 Tax=Paenibacillus sp. TaxID=58172 RepID=UPI002D3925F7|nr:hypothetical protein [Paenibacillus sp.]HZG58148.1 hypothetical protein [Paenibacillus sp.]